jgi:anti-anti-sigma regulatory factor
MPVTYQVHGDIDRFTVGQFRTDVCHAIDVATDSTVVVDFSDVQFMDSAAFLALEECWIYALGRRHALVVSSLRPPYVLMLRLFHWDHLLTADPRETDVSPDPTSCRCRSNGAR